MYFRRAEGGFVREAEDHCLHPECDNWCGEESACGLVSDALEEALKALARNFDALVGRFKAEHEKTA